MNGNEIRKACLLDPFISRYFAGVLAIDEMPFPLRPSSLYILNLSPRSHEGSHWTLCSSLQSPKYIEYFDSFGVGPPISILPNLLTQGKCVYYSNAVLQNALTQTCGNFVVLTARMLAQGISLSDMLLKYYDLNNQIPFKNDVISEEVSSQLTHLRKRPILAPEFNGI